MYDKGSSIHFNTIKQTLFVFYCVAGFIAISWPSRIPDIKEKLLINDESWGGILSSLPIGLLCAYSISSWIVSKFNHYRILFCCTILSAIILLLLSVSTQPIHLISLLFVLGVTRNVYNLCMNTSAAELQSRSNTHIISSLLGTWTAAGLFSALFGSYMIRQQIDASVHFLIVLIIAVLLVSFTIKNEKEFSKKEIKGQFHLLSLNKITILLSTISFCSMISEGAMFSWGIIFYRKAVTSQVEYSSLGYIAFIVGMVIGRFLGNRLIERCGPVSLLIVNGLLVGLGYFLAVLSPYLFTATIGFFIVGFSGSLNIPIIYTLCSRNSNINKTSILATVSFTGNCGFLFSPILIGFVSGYFDIKWAFAVVGLISVLICFICIKIKKVISSPSSDKLFSQI